MRRLLTKEFVCQFDYDRRSLLVFMTVGGSHSAIFSGMGVGVKVDFSYICPFGCRPTTQLVLLRCCLLGVCVHYGI
jgi:hypothetical protein